MSDVIYYTTNHRPNDKYRLLNRDDHGVLLESNSGIHISITEAELQSEFTKTTMSASREELVVGVPTAFAPLEKAPMRIIGIAGLARSGKDTLADYLLDNLGDVWRRSSFANPMKQMLGAIGVDCSDSNKDNIDPTFGVPVRHMMQTLGTEWGREMIHGNIWVEAFARLNAGKYVIVPDVRFENEAELVREYGVLICIEGRGGIEGGHISERKLQYDDRDIYIDNSRDLDWMISQIIGNKLLNDAILF